MKKLTGDEKAEVLPIAKEITENFFADFTKEMQKHQMPNAKWYLDLRDQIFEDLITDLGFLYKRTKNGLFAFEALYLCQDSNREIPDWVLKYLGAAAKDLIQLQDSDTSGARASEFIMGALKFKRNKGSRSVFSEYFYERERISVFYKVVEFRELAKQQDGAREKTQNVFDLVGDSLGMSPKKVEKLYYNEKRKRATEKESPHGRPHLF